MLVILKTVYFQLWFLFKKELRISRMQEKHIGKKYFHSRETTIFYTFLIRYSFKGIFVNQGGSFKITHTISLSICVRGEIDTVGLNLWNKRQHLNNSICF